MGVTPTYLFLNILPAPGSPSGSSPSYNPARGPIYSLARFAKQHHALDTISLENKTMIDPGKDPFQTVLHRQVCELHGDIIIQQRWVSHKALVKIDASLLLNPIKNSLKGRILNIGR